MMPLAELAKEMHQLCVEKGWYDDRDHGDETRLSMSALTASELSEGLEDVRAGNTQLAFKTPNLGIYLATAVDTLEPASDRDWIRSQKPIGLPSEIADVVIRALDFAVWFEIPIVEPTRIKPFSLNGKVRARWAAAFIGKMHQTCSDEDVNALIQSCYVLAANYGFDLDEAIWLKYQYNKTRPKMHGGKAL